MNFNAISIIGLGYIGLPTAATIASRGVRVIGVDINQNTVDTINRGKVHIKEPELDIIVKSTVQTGMLTAVTIPEPADVFIIAVPTPLREDKSPDLSYIENAAKAIAPVLKKGNLVILESTSPVGTTEKLGAWLAEARTDLTFPANDNDNDNVNISLAYCPERVLPGNVLHELVSNDRIVGGLTKECTRRAISLYKIFVKGECLCTDARTAEMAKLTENAYRDVNIAFANELSLICDKLDINTWELIKHANRHPRVNILQPGPGVGGHCIAVDPWFIVDSAPEEARMIRTAREVNDFKPEWVVEKILESAKQIDNPTIAFLGLSFKADIDDLRESPAVRIVHKIASHDPGKLLLVEPNIERLPPELEYLGPNCLIALKSAISLADIIVLLVDHKEFKALDIPQNKEQLLVDTRGIFNQ